MRFLFAARLFILVPLCSFSTNANNFCQENMLPILKQAYPAASVITLNNKVYRLELNDVKKRSVKLDGSYRAQCKVWPTKPELSLLAVIIDYDMKNPERWESPDADLEVFIVENKSKQILARLVQPYALSSDAIRVDSIAIDTARYHLNEKITAFGVTVNRSSRSSPNPYNSKALSLFQFSDNQISLLMDSLLVNVFGGETDTACVGEFWHTKRILIMDKAKEKSPNLSPIIVKTRIKHFSSVGVKGSYECIDQIIDIKNDKLTLYFDGGQYLVPDNITN